MQEYAQAAMVEEADLHGGLSTMVSRRDVEEALTLDELNMPIKALNDTL